MYAIIRKQKLQTIELACWPRKNRRHGNLQENGEKLAGWMETKQLKVGGKQGGGFQKEGRAICPEIEWSICVKSVAFEQQEAHW